VENGSRNQIRLILEDADARAKKAVNSRIKAIYGKYAARHALQSGAIVKAVVTAVEEMAADFIMDCVDRVTTVAKDPKAFAMIEDAVGSFLMFLAPMVDEAARMATGVDPDGRILPKLTEAARSLYHDSQMDLRRQLEIHRFTFAAPQMPSVPTMAPTQMPVPAPEKNRGGKPIAAHWDEMWSAIAVMLYTGDLQPKTQADIERAMKDWFEVKGLDVGDTAVRGRARKLWQKLESTA
jgi:hypothetical protein